MGKFTTSSAEIVRALEVVKDNDSAASIRAAAAKVLNTHRSLLEARELAQAAAKDASGLVGKRPLISTLLGGLMFAVLTFDYVTSFMPGILAELRTHFPEWYVIALLTVLYPVGIASVAGLWRMRHWGIYMYAAIIWLEWVITLFAFRRYPALTSFVLTLSLAGAGAFYFRRMR